MCYLIIINMSELARKRKAEGQLTKAVINSKRWILLDHFYSDIIPIILSYCSDPRQINPAKPLSRFKSNGLIESHCFNFLLHPRQNYFYLYDAVNSTITSFCKTTGVFLRGIALDEEGASQMTLINGGDDLLITSNSYPSTFCTLNLRSWLLSHPWKVVDSEQLDTVTIMVADPDDDLIYLENQYYQVTTIHRETKKVVTKPYLPRLSDLVMDPIHRRLAVIVTSHESELKIAIVHLDQNDAATYINLEADGSYSVVALYGTEIFTLQQTKLSMFDIESLKEGRALNFVERLRGLQLDCLAKQTLVRFDTSISVYEWEKQQ